ncbi:hypothetical protein [Rhodococcus opacus]|uniref:hypothetical protein n=1 Tax=Rhodococcus opacus TaxID=37919 RepID=UPI001C44DE74|nr:hypothetical protein [Rhodococcus opacus]MBV6762759.1 hypothetical protein [Rhodococcus opacus]
MKLSISITFSEQWLVMSLGSQPTIIGIRRPTAQNNNGKGAARQRNDEFFVGYWVVEFVEHAPDQDAAYICGCDGREHH